MVLRDRILLAFARRPARWRVPSKLAEEVCDVDRATIVEVRLVVAELRALIVEGVVARKGKGLDAMRYRLNVERLAD